MFKYGKLNQENLNFPAPKTNENHRYLWIEKKKTKHKTQIFRNQIVKNLAFEKANF